MPEPHKNLAPDSAFRLRRAFVLVSLLLFLVSLTQPGFYGGHHPDTGFGLLLIGIFGVLAGQFAWFANPVLLLAWVWLWRSDPRCRGRDLKLALVALGLALSFLLHSTTFNGIGFTENRPPVPIVGYGLGYWLWLGSIAVVVFGSLVTRWLHTASATGFGTGQSNGLSEGQTLRA